MSEVSNIYALLARNAGARAYQRGSTYGDIVNRVSQVPLEVANQRAADAIHAHANARLDAQDARQAAQDARQAAADQRDVVKTQQAEQERQDRGAIMTAGLDPANPGKWNFEPAVLKAMSLKRPDIAHELIDAHNKTTEFDPTKGAQDAAGNIVREPVTKPIVKPDYTIEGQRFSGEGAPIGDRVLPQPSQTPFTVKTMENGRMVEKVMSQADALKAGSFPSQPPASIQVNNAQAATAAAPPSKAEIAMANYMVPTPSPRSFATPAGKAMMDRILTVNPDFDASKYSVRAPTRKAFTTGMQGQQITAMNTAVEHLDQLQAAAEALKNGNFKPGNAAYQYLKETFGSNAPTNYDTIKNMVDKEVEAVANKGVPTVAGTAEQKALAGKSAGPAQLKGYIDTLIPLMGSKLNALHFQYKQAMGENDPFHVLTPQAEEILTKRGFDPTNPTVRAGAGAAPVALAPPPTGRIRIVGPGGATGTILATDQIPAGWSKQ